MATNKDAEDTYKNSLYRVKDIIDLLGGSARDIAMFTEDRAFSLDGCRPPVVTNEAEKEKLDGSDGLVENLLKGIANLKNEHMRIGLALERIAKSIGF